MCNGIYLMSSFGETGNKKIWNLKEKEKRFSLFFRHREWLRKISGRVKVKKGMIF